MAGTIDICNYKTFDLIASFGFRTTQVWLGFVISMVCVILVLIVLQRNMAPHHPSEQSRNPKDDEKDENGGPTATVHPGTQYIYVFASLLSQGLIRIK